MANDQNKVVEIGNASNEKPNANREKTEWEKMLETMMQRAFLNGLSQGMKTMCGSILNKMNECQKQGMNPQKQLIELRRWCNHCLSTVNKPPKDEKPEVAPAEEQSETTKTENKTEG